MVMQVFYSVSSTVPICESYQGLSMPIEEFQCRDLRWIVQFSRFYNLVSISAFQYIYTIKLHTSVTISSLEYIGQIRQMGEYLSHCIQTTNAKSQKETKRNRKKEERKKSNGQSRRGTRRTLSAPQRRPQKSERNTERLTEQILFLL